MITITCHNDNIAERTYAINVLFHDLLALNNEDYQIIFEASADMYVIEHQDKRIIIEDHFFRKYPNTLSYQIGRASCRERV